MWARLTRRTLLSLALGLLLLSPDAAADSCSTYQDLLRQLRKLAAQLQDHKMLLNPYMIVQGLDKLPVNEHCREHPGAFPSEDALRALSKPAFLRAVRVGLDQVLRILTPYLKTFPKVLETNDMFKAQMIIRGLRNNIHCMAQLLPEASTPAEHPQEGQGASPTPTPNTFQRKLEGCRLLKGYHRFMHSVGRVFEEWELHPHRSRRHSAPLDLWKQAWRTRASKRGKKLVSPGQRPR